MAASHGGDSLHAAGDPGPVSPMMPPPTATAATRELVPSAAQRRPDRSGDLVARARAAAERAVSAAERAARAHERAADTLERHASLVEQIGQGIEVASAGRLQAQRLRQCGATSRRVAARERSISEHLAAVESNRISRGPRMTGTQG
jgi:hypothetical protein